MTIQLLTTEDYNTLKNIVKNNPNLTFQNNGYEYIDKRKLTAEDIEALETITEILKRTVTGFQKFFNFKFNKAGEILLRFDYLWDESFTGVGYIKLSELLNGFEDKENTIYLPK